MVFCFELLMYAPISIPQKLWEIIGEKTQMKIGVDHEKYIKIRYVVDCIEVNDSYNIQKYTPLILRQWQMVSVVICYSMPREKEAVNAFQQIW